MPNSFRRWHRASIFGPGPRVPLDRELRARFRALLHLHRKPGRLTISAYAVGRVLLDMLGADGRLDPSHEYLAVKAGVAVGTVKRALIQLRALGFLDWTRRLIRDARTGWRAEQGSNAYVLRVPSCEAHFERVAPKRRIKKEAREERSAALAEMMRQAASLGPLLEKRRKAIEARLVAGTASRIGYRNERV